MHRHRTGSGALSVLATAVLLGACSANTGGAASSTPTAAGSAAASASVFKSQEASTSPGGGAAFAEGPLSAGIYTVGTAPAITFTLDDGWSTDATDPDAFDVFKDPAFVGMGTVGTIFTNGQEGTAAGTDATAAAGLFASNPDLQVSVAQGVTVGGQPGVWFDVVSAGDAPALGFLTSGGRTYRFTPDVKDRVYLVPAGGALVVITVEAARDQFDAAVALAQPVIDSVSLG